LPFVASAHSRNRCPPERAVSERIGVTTKVDSVRPPFKIAKALGSECPSSFLPRADAVMVTVLFGT